MTDEELNRAIAEKVMDEPCGVVGDLMFTEADYLTPNGMMKVLDKMTKEGYRYSIQHTNMGVACPPPDSGFDVELYGSSGYYTESSSVDVLHLPYAVALAALKAVDNG